MATCLDCGSGGHRHLRNDPRDPPLSRGPCLCTDCFRAAAEETAEDLEGRAGDLRDQVENLPMENGGEEEDGDVLAVMLNEGLTFDRIKARLDHPVRNSDLATVMIAVRKEMRQCTEDILNWDPIIAKETAGERLDLNLRRQKRTDAKLRGGAPRKRPTKKRTRR